MHQSKKGSLFQVLDEGTAHRARLNGYTLTEPIESAAAKLLATASGLGKSLVLHSYTVPPNVELRELPNHLRKLKIAIAKINGVTPANVVLRRDNHDFRSYYFMARTSCPIGGKVNTPTKENGARAVETALETLLIQASDFFDGRIASAIGPRGRAARPYLLINSRSHRTLPKRYLECLAIEFDVDRHGTLIIDAKRIVFSVPINTGTSTSTIVPVALGTDFMDLALIDIDGVRQVDARSRASRRAVPEIDLSITTVRHSRWYAINQLCGFVGAALKAAGISCDPLTFTATHYLQRKYLRPENFGFAPALTIAVDPALEMTNVGRTLIEKEIKELLLADGIDGLLIDWIKQDVIGRTELLKKDRAYLFINRFAKMASADDDDTDSTESFVGDEHWRLDEAVLDSGNSCTAQGQAIEPEEAYRRLASHSLTLDEVDCYTALKYNHVLKPTTFLVAMQGVDVRDSIQELAGQHKLNKAIAELSLKWALIEGVVTTNAVLPKVTLRATYTRSSKITKTGNLEMIAQITFKVGDDGRTVMLSTVRTPIADHTGIAAMVKSIPLIRKARLGGNFRDANGKGSQLRDATFVLEMVGEPDEDSDCLVVYDGSTVKIPRIIGSINAPLLHDRIDVLLAQAEQDGEKYLTRRKRENLLPYYIEGFTGQRGRGDYLFIEEQQHHLFLRYFVPQVPPIATSFGFSRFYDIMLYKKNDVQRINPLKISLDHPLIQMYFSMMTQDVVRINENGKHTLARKLAGLALLNWITKIRFQTCIFIMS